MISYLSDSSVHLSSRTVPKLTAEKVGGYTKGKSKNFCDYQTQGISFRLKTFASGKVVK